MDNLTAIHYAQKHIFLEQRLIISVQPHGSLDKLIDIEGMENTTRFANYLRHLFPADVKTMTMAARALGKGGFGFFVPLNIYHFTCCSPQVSTDT